MSADDDSRLVGGDVLLLVAPLAADLDGGFDCFGAGVHWQHLVELEVVGQVPFVFTELVVVEGAAGQRQAAALLYQHVDDARVAVPLVDGRVGSQKVEILLSFYVPNVAAAPFVEDDG